MRDPFSYELGPLFFPPGEGPRAACWRPLVDVYNTARGWLIKMELAGVNADDVEVGVRGQRLLVAGERRDFCVLEGQRAYSMEISYNRFERAVDLPVDLEGAEIRCESRDGMLLITVELPEARG